MNEQLGCCSRSPTHTKRSLNPLRAGSPIPSSPAPAPQAPPPRLPSPGWDPRTFAAMKFGAPRAATSRRRREGSVVVFPRAAPARAPAPVPLSGGAACVPRGAGCKRSLAPAGLLLPSPAPSLPPAGHCLRAPRPRPPPARPPRPSPPTSPDPKFWQRGKWPGSGPAGRRVPTRGVPSVFLKSTLPAAAAAAAAPAAESLGLQPGGSQVSRKTESAGGAPGKGCGWGAPTSRVRQARGRVCGSPSVASEGFSMGKWRGARGAALPPLHCTLLHIQYMQPGETENTHFI